LQKRKGYFAGSERFESITGKGVVGTVNGKKIRLNAKLMEQNNRKLRMI
jgi:cation transport ATPase